MTLSNKLTAFRIFFSPLVFILYTIDHAGAKIVCLMLVILSEITDGLDGYLARRRNETTDFGKLFDPFADSISRFTFFAAFLVAGLAQPWMILLIFFRDNLVAFIRTIASTQNIIISARRTGKIKAVTQATATIIIMLTDIAHYYIKFVPVHVVAGVMMTIVVVVTVYSAFDYAYGNRKIIKKLSM